MKTRTPDSPSTPMMQHYLEIKQAHPDALLFYRMGDFYEMFFQDAEIAARLLEITLTSRNKKDDNPIPMCGVPCRALNTYVARLIQNGYKVAICDQVENAAEAKGLVRREVVRVVTPGMIVENAWLEEKSNNFILAAVCHAATTGLAVLDLSTAAFRVTQSADPAAVRDEIQRIAPREMLLPVSLRGREQVLALPAELQERAITWLEDDLFDSERGRRSLLEQFRTLSLESFGCEQLPAAVGAAGALLNYVNETQRPNQNSSAAHIQRLQTYFLENFLVVDDVTCRNLEIFKSLRGNTTKGTLIDILDVTHTAMGARLLRAWLRYPLKDLNAIQDRLAAVAEAVASVSQTQALHAQFKDVYDLERLNSKIALGHANARDLVALRRSLEQLPVIAEALAVFEASLLQWPEHADLAPANALAELIARAIREDAPATLQEGGLINPGFNAELDELLDISNNGKTWLARLETEQKQATGINSLKVRFNKVFGYFIEVSKAQAAAVPDHYVRKQTLVNAERFITDELKQFEARVLGAEERRAVLENQIFNDIRAQVIAANTLIQDLAGFMARVDVLLALAQVAIRNHYVQPEVAESGVIDIEDGRHPVVEKMIDAERFVPNSIYLDNESQQVLLITGPNMAGKSTILRQTALTVMLAQIGAFVPARRATIGLVDRIFTRVGALDNLAGGQSTFMVEMQETAHILHHASPHSLVIMDEIGRGTSTFDGLSIAWAVAAYLHDLLDQGVKTLFATHYHELTELTKRKPRIQNFTIAVKEQQDDIIFLHRLIAGHSNRSYGIQVARLAGVPDRVLTLARSILQSIESGEFGLMQLGEASPMHGMSHRRTSVARQLALFQTPEEVLVNQLKAMDLTRMTPLEALNQLNRLQETALSC